jgi:hypothetical protein
VPSHVKPYTCELTRCEKSSGFFLRFCFVQMEKALSSMQFLNQPPELSKADRSAAEEGGRRTVARYREMRQNKTVNSVTPRMLENERFDAVIHPEAVSLTSCWFGILFCFAFVFFLLRYGWKQCVLRKKVNCCPPPFFILSVCSSGGTCARSFRFLVSIARRLWRPT